MEFLIILATLIVASVGQPSVKTWTLNELSTAIEKESDLNMQPYLVDALNQIMYALFTGTNKDVFAIIPSPTGKKAWTKSQLKKAIDNPATNPNYQPFIISALHQLYNMDAEGKHQDTMEVSVPALDISVWTISDVQEAKDSPSNPELRSYLKIAGDKIQKALSEGEIKENIRVTLVTPVGVVPAKSGKAPELIPKIWIAPATSTTTESETKLTQHVSY